MIGVSNETSYTAYLNPFDPPYNAYAAYHDSGLSDDFIIPDEAQLFDTISYYVINYNGQGWPSLRSNYVFFEKESGSGGPGGF